MRLSINKEELGKLYLVEELSQEDIGNKYNVTQVAIYLRLKKYGIKARPNVGYGKFNPFYGKKHSDITKRKQSLIQKELYKKGKKITNPIMYGKDNPFYGKKHTIETKNIIREKAKTRQIGKNNPNWKGGLSFEPYLPEFNKQLKTKILEKYAYKCRNCFKSYYDCIDKNGKTIGLQIHHIDYNKQNNNESNLLPLCNKCHTKTNSNRGYWSNLWKK